MDDRAGRQRPDANYPIPGGEFAFGADWSPDGSQISYAHYQVPDDHLEIQVMDADGATPRPSQSAGSSSSATRQTGAPPRPPSAS